MLDFQGLLQKSCTVNATRIEMATGLEMNLRIGFREGSGYRVWGLGFEVGVGVKVLCLGLGA